MTRPVLMPFLGLAVALSGRGRRTGFGDVRGQAGGGENGNGGPGADAAAGSVWIPRGSRPQR